jgi:hypothetical protein
MHQGSTATPASCFSHVAYVVRDVESASQWQEGKTQFEPIEPGPTDKASIFATVRGSIPKRRAASR